MSISKAVIKSMRRERGWSQDQLALISGLSSRTIQRIETTGECALDSKMALASAFDVSPAEFDGPVSRFPADDDNAIDWQATLWFDFCSACLSEHCLCVDNESRQVGTGLLVYS